MKLTEQQIEAVDKALFDMGIKLFDIRIEMADHVAAAIEDMEGWSFENGLRIYLVENEKELLKNYSQFKTNAKIKGLKLFISNMFTWRFAGIFSVVFALLCILYNYEGIEELSFSFYTFSIIGLAASIVVIGLRHFLSSRQLYSTSERMLTGLAGFPFLMLVPLKTVIEERAAYEILIVLYYAFVLSLYILAPITYLFLNNYYRNKYKLN